jgi:TRAP-type transport system large permease protein
MSIWIVFGLLVLFVLLRVPVVFGLILSAVLFFILDDTVSPMIVIQRMTQGLDSFPLLAIPLFVLAGNLLSYSGVARKIFDFAEALVGHIKGSLAHVNIVASIIFAGMSGTAQADAAGLGIIELEAMEKAGFKKPFSAAVTAASSIIGPIIPPSTIMVMYAVQTGAPLSSLFLAGIIPGLMMGLLLMGTSYFLCAKGIVYSPEPRRASLKEIVSSFIIALPGIIAPTVLVFGLLFGIATPTELGALIVTYVVVLGLIQKSLSWEGIWKSTVNTVITTGVIVFIISASVPFGWLLAMKEIPLMLAEGILSITTNKLLILFLINLGLLILGCFLETAAILVIVIPVLLPLLNLLGIDLVHFGILAIVNLMIGANTPPFGIILFVMMDVAKISMKNLVKAFAPFYIPMVFLLVIITLVPAISLWLPKLIESVF